MNYLVSDFMGLTRSLSRKTAGGRTQLRGLGAEELLQLKITVSLEFYPFVKYWTLSLEVKGRDFLHHEGHCLKRIVAQSF